MPSSSVLRLRVGDSGFEARQHGEAAAAAVGEILRGAVHHERNPGFGLVGDAAEPGGHDADDGPGAAVELYGAADDRGVGAESPLPQTVAEDDDGVALRHFILFRAEGAAEGRAHSQQVEVGLRDVLGGDALGLIAPR